ncbi:ABC transporter G family member 43 [Venturia nashicola]|uniref:ABC transporter G family member 43 n=1 Tax=Venturia nashicola TaxID=86259 RepID=A0A4Z1P204_9PEZI|nr:ABC transporter G family member 43 [Venturia nashicola]TLD32025.1 ABC transporter G family member 43 [Venturia nashicola]
MASILVLATISFATCVSASFSKFIFPPPPDAGRSQDVQNDPVFSVGETINLKWTVPDAQNLDLWLMQDGGTTTCKRTEYASAASLPNTGNMDWKVDRMGMALSSIYYIFGFNETSPERAGPAFNTQYINITDKVESFQNLDVNTLPSSSILLLSSTLSSSSSLLSRSSASPTLKNSQSSSPTLSVSYISIAPLSTTLSPFSTGLAVPPTTAPNASESTGSSSNNNLAVAVGVGLGIPLLFIFELSTRNDDSAGSGM